MTDSASGFEDVPARAAATLIWVRAAAHGAPEVLLMKRSAQSRFMPNAHVFAGGAVDIEDASTEAYALSRDLDDPTASAHLDLPEHGLRFFVAAVRESFEECGLLMACDAAGKLVDLTSWPEEQLLRARGEVGAKSRGLVPLCHAHAWRLALERLCYFGHWVTPVGLPRRFDTRFFIARAPSAQQASLASDEMSELSWRTPREALADHRSGRVTLMLATRSMLTAIAEFADTDELLRFARTQRLIEVVRPGLFGDVP